MEDAGSISVEGLFLNMLVNVFSYLLVDINVLLRRLRD